MGISSDALACIDKVLELHTTLGSWLLAPLLPYHELLTEQKDCFTA